MDELDTTSLHDLVARFQAGENSALHALIRRTEERLVLFTRRMLARFPAVQAKEETDDILQNALIRLTRALRQETPRSVQEFFGLATVQIHRELLDLARSHARRPTVSLKGDPPDQADDSSELDRWTALHEAVERLPADRRRSFRTRFTTVGGSPRSPNYLVSATGKSGGCGSTPACA